MSKVNVDKFLGLMQKDESLARKMAACLYMLENGGGASDGSGGFIAREIVPLAKEYGFEFTEQDFLDYTNEATAKAGLSAEDLAEVSGGKGGVRAALMGTLALLVVAAAPAAMERVSGGEVSPFSMVTSAAEGNEVDVLKGKADTILSNVEAALRAALWNCKVEEITAEIQTVEDFLQYLNSLNIDDPELNQKKSELEQKKAELGKKAAQSLAPQMEAKIDNIKRQLRSVNLGAKTDLETNLKKALNQAKPAYEALAAALKGDDAEKISDALKDARTQYEDFIGAIKTYLKGLKAEVEEALRTEVDDSRPYLAKIKETLQNDTSDDHDIDEQLEKGQLTWIQYIRIDLANIKTVKASYDKLDELKVLIDEQKEQLDEDNQIIVDAKKQEQQLRNKLNSETTTAGLASGCVAEVEKEINELKAAVEAWNYAKEAAQEPMAKLKKAITDAAGSGGQALEDAIKLKTELDNAKSAEEFNKAVGKIKRTIEALNKAKLAEFPAKAPMILLKLRNKLKVLEEAVNVQNRTDKQETINELLDRIEKFGKVARKNAAKKEKELKSIEKDINYLNVATTDFEGNLSIHVKKPKKNIGEMLTFFKNAATQAKDKAAVEEIEKLEHELAAMLEELPKSQKELIEIVVKLKNITKNIPQIKAMLNKATTLKKISEQVDDRFAEKFDKIIKDIEAADSVEKVVFAGNKLANKENELKALMRTKINEAKGLYNAATKLGVRNLEVATLRLIEDASGIDSLEEGSIDKIKQLSAGLNKIGQDIKNYLGKQIDSLVAQANELKEKAQGVDNKLYDDFNTTATNLAEDKDELLKDLRHAAQTIFNVIESLAERQGDLMPKLALKSQIDTLKAQATKLAELLKGKGIINNVCEASFSTIKQALEKINLSDRLNNITKKLAEEKDYMNDLFKQVYQQLVAELELDELLKNEVMGAEIQAELKAIKAALAEDKADAAAVLKAVDDLKAAKTKMANKLLEWHKILSEYHNAEEGIENMKDAIAFKLASMKATVEKMIAGTDGIKLDAETLNATVDLAIEIADNLNTDIVSAVGNVQSYNGFGSLDITAGTQANTLATFLREKVDIVDDLKFVDKQTRAKLAKDIKHIFDQIKIDQETGKYYLPGFYNQLGAVNHDGLKLICEAYDVIAEDFGERVSYTPFVEGTAETTSGWSFSSMLSSITGAKKQNQLINKANHLITELKKVSRLDLLDVSPESRDALKKDILEIASQIQSRAHSWRFNKSYYYFSDIDDSLTKNMQSGLEKILEFYNSIQAQIKVKK